MIRSGTILDQTYGCAKQNLCSIDYYLMSFISRTYKFFPDRAVDTPGHGKYVVDDFNAVHKKYLATCLRIRSTPEVNKIDIKRIRVDAITDKGEVRFAK